VLGGLGPGGSDRVLVLPDLGARAMIDWAQRPQPTDLKLTLDTVHIDLDAERMDLLWRGFTVAGREPKKQIDRVLVGFASDKDYESVQTDDAALKLREVLRELPRGEFLYAWEYADAVEGKAPPKPPEEELEMARHEALGSAAPMPTLTLAEHASLAAELIEVPFTPGAKTPSTEERLARQEILGRHGFDEFAWSVEERAHADRLASVPSDSDGGLHAEYGLLFKEAQDSFGRPEDPLPSARDYASLLSRMTVESPRDVLGDARLSFGAWARLDRRWQEKMADDPRAAKEVEEHLEREQIERPEPAMPEVDDEGGFVT
jgi:hypothetical protein